MSKEIFHRGNYEPKISQWIEMVHFDFPHAILVDVGANLGFHSLYSAKLGHRVWSVEPEEVNVARIMKSAIFPKFAIRWCSSTMVSMRIKMEPQ